MYMKVTQLGISGIVLHQLKNSIFEHNMIKANMSFLYDRWYFGLHLWESHYRFGKSSVCKSKSIIKKTSKTVRT